jgi:hypothetical protein
MRGEDKRAERDDGHSARLSALVCQPLSSIRLALRFLIVEGERLLKSQYVVERGASF